MPSGYNSPMTASHPSVDLFSAIEEHERVPAAKGGQPHTLEREPSVLPARGLIAENADDTFEDDDQDEEPTLPSKLSSNSLGLRKPIEAVLIRPKEGKVTLLIRRFFNVLLRHAQSNPVADDEYHRMPLGKLIQDARYESRNMEYLVEVLNQMLGTVVNWGDSAKNLNGPKYRWSGASLLAYASIEKEGRNPAVLTFDFHKEIRMQLLNPRVYAFVSLELNAKMSTHPALALYELGARYVSNKNGLTMRMPWREWVGPLTGNPDINEELQYKYFARDVLKPAIQEVNEAQSEFEIIVLPGIVRRKVESLQFAIKRLRHARTTRHTPLSDVEVDSLTLIGRLISLGIPQKLAEEFLRTHGAARLRLGLTALDARRSNTRLGPIENPSRYLKKLLEDGEFSDAPILEVSATPLPEEVTHTEPLSLDLKRRYIQHMKAQARALHLEGSLESQEETLKEFESQRLASLSIPLRKAWMKFRSEWPARPMSPFIEVTFIDWLASDYLKPSSAEVTDWAMSYGLLQLSADAL